MRRWWKVASRTRLTAIALATTALACHARDAATAASDGGAEVNPTPDAARVIVTKDRKDLIFTYLDATGAYHDVSKVDDVPEASRGQVLIRDLSKSPDDLHAADYLYIADLRTADSNGHYPCGAVSRRGFERTGASDVASQVAEKMAQESGNLVTIYTASWCGVCKQAKAFLRSKGIPFVERDVEKDSKAEAELEVKARARGLRPQGVPVIDVAGELMMGFDPDALTALLGRKGLAKTL
jgi:glutaredoxin